MRRAWALLALYPAALISMSAIIVLRYDLDPDRKPTDLTIVSVWHRGSRIARTPTRGDPTHVLSEHRERGKTRVFERVVDEGPVLTLAPPLLGASMVAGRDGLAVRHGDREAWLTPDDLLRHGLQGPEREIAGVKVVLGIDVDRALRLLAEELGVGKDALFREGRFRRFVVHRSYPAKSPSPSRIGPETLTHELLHRSVLEAANYLVRHLRRDGLYEYEVVATDNTRPPGYSWPRHAGATFFLAEVAHREARPTYVAAAQRAAYQLRDRTTLRCGKHRCVGEGTRAELGSSALALLAYAELVRAGAALDLSEEVRELAAFLRSQQRPDGEFMHEYDLGSQRRIDVQFEFFSGEATFALSRAHRITKDPRDLEAAGRGLRYLTEGNRKFPGARYLYDAHHWTCQALEDLWRRAPNHTALRFCIEWQSYLRALQLGNWTELGDYEGAYTDLPWVVPRLGAAASRTEAGIATLVTATYAGWDSAELARLEAQGRRALAYILRHQFAPGPTHLFVRPSAARGGFPGSPFDYRIRIDLPQHAGSAMLRYLRLLEERATGKVSPPP